MSEILDSFDYDVRGEPIFVDEKGTKFYESLWLMDVFELKRGDCVKMEVCNDDNDIVNEYGQILAIFVPLQSILFDDIMIEIRWFQQASEINNILVSKKQKRQKISVSENELVESDIVDDITAGAIREKIQVLFSEHVSTLRSSNTLTFSCRYFKSAESHSLVSVEGHNFVERGFEYSEYKDLYSTHNLASTPQRDNHYTASMQDIFQSATKQLHISVIPEYLPCRSAEMDEITQHLRQYIKGDCTAYKPIYISGMPGTGKTATVLASIAKLKKECRSDLPGRTTPFSAGSASSTTTVPTLPPFNFIQINCLKLSSPVDAYTVFWRCLTGQHLSSHLARKKLSDYYTTRNDLVYTSSSDPLVPNITTVLLLDELDFLSTHDDNVLYTFFNWPLLPASKLVLIGVSNVFDMPEKIAKRVQSRAGLNLLRVTFKTYNHEQIREILTHRLKSLSTTSRENQIIFDPKTLELLARKAASVAGDLRAALKICQRTIQIFSEKKKLEKCTVAAGASTDESDVDANSTRALITIEHGLEAVRQAVDEYTLSPFQIFIRHACQLDKVLIISVCKHIKMSGELSIKQEMLWDRMGETLISISNMQQVESSTEMSEASSKYADTIHDITVLHPPYEIFEMALARLIEVGIMKRHTNRMTEVVLRESLLSLNADSATVAAALKHTVLLRLL